MTSDADEPRASAEADAPAPPAPGSLPAGRVGRPHGLDGSFYVTRPRPRLLTLGAGITVAGRGSAIVRRAGTEQRPIVRLEGVDDRSAAEALRGSELLVDGAAAPALEEGEWWAHELEGCAVMDGERLLGTVSRLLELPSCEALEVLPADGGEAVLVPMVADAVREVAPARRRIDVDLEFLGLAEPAGAPSEHTGERARERGDERGDANGGEAGR
ncbi:MAG TPA: ribosome maturation factor RimM [Solirubrobacteraceae bacterium]|nr:ribosome maturation factor RimM [Solirubrobacteraceae bacterium]